MIKTIGFAPGLAFAAALCATLYAHPAIADNHGAQRDAPGAVNAPMSARDLVTMPRLGAPSVSPDGHHVIYQVTETDPTTLERTPAFYLRSLDDLEMPAIRLNLGEGAGSVTYGPDGAIYWLTDRRTPAEDDIEKVEGYSRVWRGEVTADGVIRGALPFADFHGEGIDGFHIAPTGDKIAVWAAIARDCPRFGCEDDGKKHLPGPGDGRLYDGSDGFIRHWDRWTSPGTTNRVFVFDMENGELVGDGVPLDGQDPETGLTANTPTTPFGGGEDIAWAADGRSVYFAARVADAKEPVSTDLDIYWSDLSGKAPVELTAANTAYDALPTPSPDGKYLAYVAMARSGYEADRLVVQLRDLATGETRALTQDIDRSFGSLAWTPDSRFIVATAQDVLDTPAFRIDVATGAVEKLDLMAGNEAHIGNVTTLEGGRLVFTRDSIGTPSELYLSNDWGQAKPLTDVAMSRMGEMASTMTTRFSFAGAGGDTVYGQITRLENQQGPIPAILYIHGGPQGSFNDGWSSRWNPRVLASQGYAVISVDFHGSTGYGQEFTDAINQDWGGKPLEDLKLGLAAALAKDPQIDGERACAMGASYGGYMVNWIAGNWPDRFKCLVQHDGLFDMRSFYFSTEELWFPRWDFGGSYAENPELYEKWNPVNHVDKWQTPMLVVTGEKDFRVPYTQGIQSFTALQERGIPSQLLVFPEENHWVLGAKNSLQWHQTVFAWLDRWLGEEDSSEAGNE